MIFTVEIRKTYLKENEPGAVEVYKYRHPVQGEPALNRQAHMTKAEAQEFNSMLKINAYRERDIVAGKIVTYTIDKD